MRTSEMLWWYSERSYAVMVVDAVRVVVESVLTKQYVNSVIVSLCEREGEFVDLCIYMCKYSCVCSVV